MSIESPAEPEPSDSLKAFGEAHKAFRKRAGYTQEEYAPMVGYQPSTVGSIEQGRRFPQRKYVDRAEEVLDAFGALKGRTTVAFFVSSCLFSSAFILIV